ncbi:MAG: hypothetical protein K9J21_03480 [Bacteroidales bacterium]|nr:hypothetical protein [Bacteroidales bacterium]
MENKIHILLGVIFLLSVNLLQSQVDTTHPDYKKLYYGNGNVSSEGIMIDGEPNGYWKTYYKDGTLKSEGNRKNFKLDSTWKFYDQQGNLSMIINYEQGLKNGLRVTYSEDEIKTEHFKDGVKDGWSKVFFPDSTLKREVKYVDGKKDGFEKEYDREGNIVTLKKYDQGFLVSREFINRRDKQGRKQGPWKTFYNNGNLKTSVTYLNGKKNGIYKKYNKNGGLVEIKKYKNGKEITDDEQVADYEIKRNYYNNGQVKTKATYLNDKMDGVRREYDKEGNITKSYVMDQGRVEEKGGIVDKSGLKQGKWEEYYESGQIKAKGKYKDGVKVGEWVYYFENGQIEQRGKYNENGKAEGLWRWYYPDGQLRKQEYLDNGVPDGMYKEYTYEGELWAKGKYVDGNKEGPWLVSHRGYKEVGKYQNDVRQGEWKHYKNGELVYEGRFEDGLPDGRHVSYWQNGNKKKEGVYNMGEKNGEWKHYTRDGQLFLVITYKFGKEVEYDNKKIEVSEEQQKE